MKNRFYRVVAVSVIAVLGAVGLTACGKTDDYKDKYDEIKSQYEELQGQYGTVTDEYGNLQGQYGELENEYEGLQGQYGVLETEHGDLQSQYDGLETEYSGLQGQYGELGTEYGAAAKELAMYSAVLDYYKTVESNTLNFDTAGLPEKIAAVVNEVIAGLKQVKAGTMTTAALAELHTSITEKFSALYTITEGNITAVETGIDIGNVHYRNDSYEENIALGLDDAINDDIYIISYCRYKNEERTYINITGNGGLPNMRLYLVTNPNDDMGWIDDTYYQNNGWTAYYYGAAYFTKNDVLVYIITEDGSFVFPDGVLKIEYPRDIEGIRFTVGDYSVELFFAEDNKIAYRVNGGAEVIVGTSAQFEDEIDAIMNIITNKLLKAVLFTDGLESLYFESYAEAEAAVKDIPAGLDAIKAAIAGE